MRVDIGNPPAVVLVEDLAEAGPLGEPPGYDAADFPDGVNVEFVARLGPDHLSMRVYERGVGETYSCGTGACAAAVAVGTGHGPWGVDMLGGRLEVAVDAHGALDLTGPAEIVASGDFRWPGR